MTDTPDEPGQAPAKFSPSTVACPVPAQQHIDTEQKTVKTEPSQPQHILAQQQATPSAPKPASQPFSAATFAPVPAIAPASSTVASEQINKQSHTTVSCPMPTQPQQQQQQQRIRSEQKMCASSTLLRVPPAWFLAKLDRSDYSEQEYDRRIDQFVRQHPEQCDVEGTVTSDADGKVTVTPIPDEAEQAPAKPGVLSLNLACPVYA